jgi:hypothetical protein
MTKAAKGRQRRAAGPFAVDAIERQVSSIQNFTTDQLNDVWRERLGTEPPAIRSREVLLRLLAWRVQSEAFGGLDAPTELKLREIAKALERDGSYEPKIRRELSPGVILTREWKGVAHKVTVTASGFQHQGKGYRSLSDIARTITGTRWSGPRFFGLEQKTAKETSR